MATNETYMFMSQPRAVDAARKKYRDSAEDEEGFDNTANLMFDPRVIRGITCTGPDVNKTQLMEEKENPQDQMYNNTIRKEQLLATGKIRPTHDSVAEIHEKIVVPKIRVEVPLHLYLLEQEQIIPTTDQDTQTDVFLEEEEAPKFIAKKTGVDVETQVENEQVFNYDIDVLPILQVVISKTVEQSLMEVRQEEQLRTVSRKRENLQDKARLRAEVAAKLEQDEKAALRAKEQMLAEQRQRHQRELATHQKLASNVFASQYLSNLQEAVFNELEEEKYFFNPMQRQVEKFGPWLQAQIVENLKGVEGAEELTDMLIAKTLSRVEELRRATNDRRKAAIAAKLAAEEEEKRKAQEILNRAAKIELYIHTDVVDEPVGPIVLSGNSTVAEIKDKILEWMNENVPNPPDESSMTFLYNGGAMDPESVLYEIGMETLSTIQMIVTAPVDNEEEDDD